MAVDMTKNAPMSAIKELGDKIKDTQVKLNDVITDGGEPNKIESIAVNGTVQTPDENKQVNITVPTKTSDLTNDSEFMTENEIKAAIKLQIGSVFTPKGTVSFSELPALSAENVGGVYNISDAFITTADFEEGAGVSHPMGANIAIVETSPGVYKYDVLSGTVDLSNYYTKGEIDAMTATDEEVKELIDSIFSTT